MPFRAALLGQQGDEGLRVERACYRNFELQLAPSAMPGMAERHWEEAVAEGRPRRSGPGAEAMARRGDPGAEGALDAEARGNARGSRPVALAALPAGLAAQRWRSVQLASRPAERSSDGGLRSRTGAERRRRSRLAKPYALDEFPARCCRNLKYPYV